MSNKEKYKKYITSKEWKEKKEKLFDLRGKECEQCGYTHRLHVHHLTYENLGYEKMDDLQILCYQCHMSKHDKYFEKFVLKIPPLKKGEIRLTADLLAKLRTEKGGITKHVYTLFGYKGIPKKKGWFKSKINTAINESKYNKAVEAIRNWEEERVEIQKSKKPVNENKKLKLMVANDLRSKGIKSINGKSVSYMDLITLKKLHQVYCS